jgi:hypothetical protein
LLMATGLRSSERERSPWLLSGTASSQFRSYSARVTYLWHGPASRLRSGDSHRCTHCATLVTFS